MINDKVETIVSLPEVQTPAVSLFSDEDRTNKVETVVNPNILSVRETGAAFGLGQSLSSPRNVYANDYVHKLLGGNSNLDQSTILNTLVDRQSGLQMTGNAIVQLGATILGGTITGVGSLLNLPQTVYNQVADIFTDGRQDKWDSIINDGLSSIFTEAGIAIEESAREAFPIYQTERAQEGGWQGMGDATWWASRFPSVGSAAASLLPVLAQARLVNYAGKGLTAINSVNRFGRGANALGRTLLNPKTQTIIGAISGAHLDSMEEISRGYDEQYQYALDLGLSEDDARNYASTYASTAYNKAWLYGFAFNVIELNSILRATNKGISVVPEVDKLTRRNIKELATKGKNFTGLEYTAAKAADDIADLSRLGRVKASLKPAKEHLEVIFSEGFEEMRVDYALQEGELAAKRRYDIYDPLNYVSDYDKFVDFINSNEAWDSFIWGAFGGLTVSAGRSIAQKIVNPKSVNEFQERQYKLINDALQRTSELLIEYDGDLSIRPDIQTVTNADGTTTERVVGIDDPARNLYLPLFNLLGQANAIEYGEAFLDEVLNLTDEELSSLYGDGKREIVKELRKEFQIATDIYRRNKGVSWGSKFDEYIQNHISSLDYLKDYYNRKLSTIDVELSRENILYNQELVAIENQLKIIDAKRFEAQQAIIELEQVNKDVAKDNESLKASQSELNIKLQNSIGLISVQDEYIQRDNSKLEELNNKLNEIQSQINDASLSLSRTNSENGKQVYRNRLNRLNREYDAIQGDIASVKANISFNELVKSRHKLEEATYRNQLVYTNRQITANIQTIADNNDYINIYNKRLQAETDSQKSIKQDYDTIKSKINNIKSKDGLSLKVVKKIKRDLQSNLAEVTGLLNDKYGIADTLNKAYDEIQTLAEENERIKQEQPEQQVTGTNNTGTTGTTTNSQEVETSAEVREDTESDRDNIEDTPSVPKQEIRTEQDVNGITFQINPETSIIQAFYVNSRKYEKGSTYNNKVIQSIGRTSNDEITILFNDNTESLLKDIETSPQDTLIEDIYNIASIYSSESINKDFVKALEKLSGFINSRGYKTLFSTITYNSYVSQSREQVLGNLIANFSHNINNASVNLTEEQHKLYDKVIARLNNDKVGAYKSFTYNKLYEYLQSKIKLTPDALNSNVNNEIVDKYIPKLIRDLTNYINTFAEFNTSDNSFHVNRIYGLEEFTVNLRRIVDNFTANLNTNLNAKFQLESVQYVNDDINNALDTIIDSIEAGFKSTVSTVMTVQNNELTNIENLVQNSEPTDVVTSEQLSGLTALSTALKSANENYATNQTPLTEEGAQTIRDLYNDVVTLLTADWSTVEMTPEQRAAFNQSGIETFIDKINEIYQFYNTYTEAYNNSGINTEAALNAIDVLARVAGDDFSNYEESDITGNYFYTPNDYEYYLSASDLAGIKALDQIVARFRLTNKYTPSHKLTYQDVLDFVYNDRDGVDKLERLYEPIWNALRHIVDYDRINAIKARIKANVAQDKYNQFFDTLDNIQRNVQAPLRSVDKKFVDGNNNIRRSYLTEFKRNFKRYAWQSEVHEGVILPTNDIYQSLNDMYDSQNKTLDHTTVIDGQEFTATELIEAQKNLRTGQELIAKIDETNGDVRLYTTINNKVLPIGSLSLNQSFKFGNLPLSREVKNSGGLNVYNSFLGTSDRLSDSTNRLISALSNSQRIFDKVREYYKEYYNARLKGIIGTDEVNSKLSNILNELGQINVPEGMSNNTAYNAILAMSNYNTEREDTDSVNYDAVYNVIEPVFYNVDFNSIDDYVRWGARIRQTYTNLNAQLATNFNATSTLRDTLAADPNAKIVVSYINKTSISYADARRSRNNVNNNIEKTTEINSKPAVNIVSVQKIDNVPILSSLTTNSVVDTEFANDTLLNPDRHFQLQAEVRWNGDSNGVSYIPLKRSPLSYATSQDNQYSELATAFITDAMDKIIGDRFATNLSSKPSKNAKAQTFVATETFKNSNNESFGNLLDDMGEAIIIDSNNDNNTIPWFNVSNLYINQYSDGTSEMSKNIEFIVVNRRYNNSYGYNIRVVYDYNEDTSAPSTIKRLEITRTRTLSGRVRGEQTPGFTAKQLGAKYGEDSNKARIDPKYKKAVINVNSNQEVSTLLKSKMFTDIFRDMQRSVNTAYNNGSYTFTSRASGKSFGANINQVNGTNIVNSSGSTNANGETVTHKIFKGSYESSVLTWAKRNGLYNGKTTYDSIQDFYLDTDAVTTGAVGIRDSETGEVITNYQLNGTSPKVYVTVESDVLQPKPIEKITVDAIEKSYNILQGVQSPTVQTAANWFNNLAVSPNNYRDIFNCLGITDESLSKEAADIIYKLYADTYSDLNKLPLIIVNSANEYTTKTGKTLQGDFENLKAEFSPANQAIVIFSSLFNKAVNDVRTVGDALTHETLHVRIRQLLLQQQANSEIVTELNSIISTINDYIANPEELKNLNVNDIENLKSFMTAINSAGENAYTELISYAFTDATLADILNHIDVQDRVTKDTNTIWNRIINALLELLGFTNIKSGSALGYIRDVVASNINSSIVAVASSTPFPTGFIETSTSADTNITASFDTSFEDIGIDDSLFSSVTIPIKQVGMRGGRLVYQTNSSNPFDSNNNFISLDGNQYLANFKDAFSDETNLKIC